MKKHALTIVLVLCVAACGTTVWLGARGLQQTRQLANGIAANTSVLQRHLQDPDYGVTTVSVDFRSNQFYSEISGRWERGLPVPREFPPAILRPPPESPPPPSEYPPSTTHPPSFSARGMVPNRSSGLSDSSPTCFDARSPASPCTKTPSWAAP